MWRVPSWCLGLGNFLNSASMQCLGIFTSLSVEVAMTNLFCVQHRENNWGPEIQLQVASCFRKDIFLPQWWAVEMVWKQLSFKFSHMVTKGFFSSDSTALSHIFSRIITRHIVKFEHLSATILVTPKWLVTVARTISSFFSILDLISSFTWLSLDGEYWQIPLTNTKFQL